MKKILVISLISVISVTTSCFAEEGRKKLSQLEFDRKGEVEKPSPTPTDPTAQLIHAITNESQIKSNKSESESTNNEILVEETPAKKKRSGVFAPID